MLKKSAVTAVTVGLFLKGTILANRTDKATDGYIPFMVRFKAWWDGLEPEALVPAAQPTPGSENTRPAAAGAIEVDTPDLAEEGTEWPESRLAFCRRLWGEDADEVRPGGAEFSVKLVRPMALNNSNSLLDLSAGLGGGCRKVHETLGIWVSGFDRDAALAEHGATISMRRNLSRKVSIRPFDAATVKFKARSFDGVLMREMLFDQPDRDGFFADVAAAVRPFGHIVATDFMLADEEARELPLIQAWLSRETETADPAIVGAYTPMLEALGFDVRVEEDETEDYTRHVLSAWAQFVEGLSREDLTRDFVNRMMVEAEIWLIRMRALESGALRLYRYHAIKKSDI